MPEEIIAAADPLAEEEDAPVTEADKPREPTPYERKLRTEARKYRIAAKEAEAKAAGIAESERARADAAIAAEREASRKSVIRAKLEAHAVKAGIVDLDGLQLADLSAVTLDDAGRLQGGEAALAALKESKPWLFGATGTTSTPVAAPKGAETKPKSAKDMGPQEWEAEKKRLGFK